MVFGIDLGTTNSCLARFNEMLKKAEVLQNRNGSLTTPSVVYFPEDPNAKVIVGTNAKKMLLTDPDTTIKEIKREMGNESCFGPNRTKHFPRELDPSEISALILRKLIKDAADFHNLEVKDVVITTPARFDTIQRERTKQAGIAAGLNVVSIISEPTAAALAYGVQDENLSNQTILVYDLGGGTFDISVIKILKDEGNTIRVIAVDGDDHLGGADWDKVLAEDMLAAFNKTMGTNFDLSSDTLLRNKMLSYAEDAKQALTDSESTKCFVSLQGKESPVEITRQHFDQITKGLLDKTISITRKVLDYAAQKGFGKPDKILLVGGSCRMPQVKERVSHEFDCEVKIYDPDMSVAKGAAIFAITQSQEIFDLPPVEHYDVLTKTYGLGVNEHDVFLMLYRNSLLPTSHIDTFFTKYDNQKTVTLPVYECDYDDNARQLVTGGASNPDFIEVSAGELHLEKDWPEGTPIEVEFRVHKDGILHWYGSVNNDNKEEFDLKINGVKNEAELRSSQAKIDKML